MHKVLLVEDEEIQLKIRQAVLQGAGFGVVTAKDAENALLALNQTSDHSQISIVITDHFLPGMNGVEFARRIRALNSTIPIIVLSGLPDAQTEYDGLNIIFRQKPCPPPEIISLVQRSFNQVA